MITWTCIDALPLKRRAKNEYRFLFQLWHDTVQHLGVHRLCTGRFDDVSGLNLVAAKVAQIRRVVQQARRTRLLDFDLSSVGISPTSCSLLAGLSMFIDDDNSGGMGAAWREQALLSMVHTELQILIVYLELLLHRMVVLEPPSPAEIAENVVAPEEEFEVLSSKSTDALQQQKKLRKKKKKQKEVLFQF